MKCVVCIESKLAEEGIRCAVVIADDAVVVAGGHSRCLEHLDEYLKMISSSYKI